MHSDKFPTNCIVIPCYNEENRLPLHEYENFLNKNTANLLCFVNDGSKDNTERVLLELKNKFPEHVDVVSYNDNKGKAEAVRNGINYCNIKYDHQLIAYLDADLATTLEECERLMTFISDDINFIFGSRILKIGSNIERGKFRFVVGRGIATVISNILKLKVYDTQCGCKIFTKKLATQLFNKPFISKWLFDVEIFKRFILIHGLEKATNKMLEVPLKSWIDKGESKVSPTYFFRMWWDLMQINKSYNASSKVESKIINEKN